MIKCNKCDGKGTIDGFSHIANGICFQCKGCGKIKEAKNGSVTYSRAYINQYYQKGYFPAGLTYIPAIQILANAGHQTAEQRLLLIGNEYYIGQPVCRGSIWYIISVSEFDTFKKHWNKVNGKKFEHLNLK